MSLPTRPRTGPSLQRRVGNFTTLAVAIAVLVTGLAGYVAARIAATSAVDAVLVAVSDTAIAGLGPSPDRATIQHYVSTNSELGYVVTAVVEADGEVFRPGGTSSTIPIDKADMAVAAGTSDVAVHTVVSRDGAHYRVRVVPIGQQAGFALMVGRPLAATQHILGSLALALVVFGVVAVIAVGIAAQRFARVGIAPVRDLTTEVEERAGSDDLEPVQVVREDEIGRLAVAFNHVLSAVQVSRIRQTRLVADAGHELRTPLTSMRTNVELLVADAERSMLRPEDRTAITRDVRTQLTEFSDLVADLIALTRENRRPVDFAEVDVAEVLDQSLARVRVRGPGLQWEIDIDSGYLHGDADMLGRAFTNLLDNAVKFSPEGGTVRVSLRGTQVSVQDQGHGIDEEEREFVFDRFYRSEQSRHTPGTGLGLSIVQAVVVQHDGTVAVAEAPGGGALFTVTFPQMTAQPVRDEVSQGVDADA